MLLYFLLMIGIEKEIVFGVITSYTIPRPLIIDIETHVVLFSGL